MKRTKQKSCAMEMAGKLTRYEQALINIYSQTKMNDRHAMNKMRNVHTHALI
ncbi:unnamed protein product [Schistosoma mansoni]|uniref:Smp_205170 n=1 Tax=Schistosoma mansoni TaxID=6183 RepID=UPI00022C85FB|nr:unnamed protein product [Schistosoma mansoni]|eukprot:XP_018647343.1 unnamed protein product [Schistosoma mansoni]